MKEESLTYEARSIPAKGHRIGPGYFPIEGDEVLLGIDPRRKPISCLIEQEPRTRTAAKKASAFEPTQEPIFSELAQCDSTDKIIEFANRYGRLTGEYIGIPLKEKDGLQIVPGEPLSLWRKAAQRVKQAMFFFKCDEEEAAEQIVFIDKDSNGNPLPLLQIKYTTQPIADEERIQHLPTRDGCATMQFIGRRWKELISPAIEHGFIKSGDYVTAARYIAAHIVADALAEHPTRDGLILRKDGKFDVRAVPQNLLARIWLAFAETLAGERKLQKCLYCGRWIETRRNSPELRFHSRCQKALKTKKSRDKPKYMNRLAAGLSPEEVAVELGITPVILAHWLSTDKKQGGAKE